MGHATDWTKHRGGGNTAGFGSTPPTPAKGANRPNWGQAGKQRHGNVSGPERGVNLTTYNQRRTGGGKK